MKKKEDTYKQCRRIKLQQESFFKIKNNLTKSSDLNMATMVETASCLVLVERKGKQA